MLSSSGWKLLVSLPDDVLGVVCRSLTPKDVCTLSLCCKTLNSVASSDKVWLPQCQSVGVLNYDDLVKWRKGVSSFKCLCKFLVGVRPLFGIWVHQNPELGNLVYVMPGFLSVVACRVIPQEVGASGIQDSALLWAPVFEVIADQHGSMLFLLHGRERDIDYLYPGSINSVNSTCNVLLLEVNCSNSETRLFPRSISNTTSQRLASTTNNNNSRLVVPFSRLAFGDRRKLLEIVTDQVRLKVPDFAKGPLFARLRDDVDVDDDTRLLSDRRFLLMQMYSKVGEGCADSKHTLPMLLHPTQLEISKIKKSLQRPNSFRENEDGGHYHSTKRTSVAGYFKYSLQVILGRSSMVNHGCDFSSSASSSNEKRYAQLHEFLRPRDTIGLALHASTVKLSTYRAWPNMHENRFALYKLPVRLPAPGHEYAGLWGGTFGWPPGRPTEDKPGKALFFLLLSYQESEGQQILIATKILEGTHYVLHPNGSAMFVAKVDEMSADPFPWDTDEHSRPVDVKHAYNGEGIANGYGFRYPGSKPGSLFVIQGGFLAFVWRESRAVLTLQRLDLQDLLKKGEQVPALPPIGNFAYLTKSYSNVFTGFSNTMNCFSSPRILRRRGDLLGA